MAALLPHPNVERPLWTWANATYPLLVVRVIPGVYSLRPLPGDLSREVLTALAATAMDACGRRYHMCLMFSPKEPLYFLPEGGTTDSEAPPSGGVNLAFYPPELDFLPATREVHRLVIHDQQTETDRNYLDASVTDQGDLVLTGQDIGETPKRFFGDDDYEYWRTVPAPHVPTVLLHLIKDRFRNDIEFVTWCREKGIPCRFEYWI
jgi:hypothetical protein